MKEVSASLNYIDRLGASASLVCAIHCAFTPFAVTILPLFGIAVLADERVEQVILSVSLALAATSVCWGIRIHKQRRILVLFSAALSLVIIGRFMLEGFVETLFVAFGALLFVWGHLLNRRLCQLCSVCKDF
jgi:hypothetical protein